MQKITISFTLFLFNAGIKLQTQTEQYALEFNSIYDYMEFNKNLVLPNTLTLEMWLDPYATYILDPDNGFGQYFKEKMIPMDLNIDLIGYHTLYHNGISYGDRDGVIANVNNCVAAVGNRIAGWHHLAVIIQKIDTDISDVMVYRNGDFLFTKGVSSVLNDSTMWKFSAPEIFLGNVC